MTENEKTIKAFCDQFTPPLKYVRTERINNVPMPDAWQASYWDNPRSIGITTVAYSGGLHAFIEAAGKGEIATEAGRVIAQALGLFLAEESSCNLDPGSCKHERMSFRVLDRKWFCKDCGLAGRSTLFGITDRDGD